MLLHIPTSLSNGEDDPNMLNIFVSSYAIADYFFYLRPKNDIYREFRCQAEHEKNRELDFLCFHKIIASGDKFFFLTRLSATSKSLCSLNEKISGTQFNQRFSMILLGAKNKNHK